MRHDVKLHKLAYGDILDIIAESGNLTKSQASDVLRGMSFSEYSSLLETGIIPPSGNRIGASGPTKPQPSPTLRTGAPNPQGGNDAWDGKSPLRPGMNVGISDDKGNIGSVEVKQVDTAANGTKVFNPATGEVEWRNNDELEAMLGEEISIIKRLAGLGEMCSAGATGVGGITTSIPAKRKKTEEGTALKKEYSRTSPAKTIIGDTKPAQASGELSANLAASGKKTASRPNNGLR